VSSNFVHSGSCVSIGVISCGTLGCCVSGMVVCSVGSGWLMGSGSSFWVCMLGAMQMSSTAGGSVGGSAFLYLLSFGNC